MGGNLETVARKLLKRDDIAEQEQWGVLEEVHLDREVSIYRGAIRDLTAELTARGVPILGEEIAVGDKDVKPSSSEVEGFDYHHGSVDDIDPSEWQVPSQCIPINANVNTFAWRELYETTHFDVIMMDPPWQLATANPTRGVALGYSQLTDADIMSLPVNKLQRNGFLFIWVINAKYAFTLDLFQQWGYEIVEEIVWVKTTVNKRLAKSHGYYLQHAKEVCLVGRRGGSPGMLAPGAGIDTICSERRGQSQKPEEIYHLIEGLVPDGRYLEIFGRKNNLRDFWVTIGNEVTGTGLPEEDLLAGKCEGKIPGAEYGVSR